MDKGWPDETVWFNTDTTHPHRPMFCIVYGEHASGYTDGKYGIWRWDGGMWWCEDGAEIADREQVATSWWTPAPDKPPMVK